MPVQRHLPPSLAHLRPLLPEARRRAALLLAALRLLNLRLLNLLLAALLLAALRLLNLRLKDLLLENLLRRRPDVSTASKAVSGT